MATNPARPLAPHLGIWRWRVHMLVSILHRATGDGLAFAGTLLFVWWLAAAASGPEGYATFLDFAGGWFARLIFAGLTWAFFQHTLSGLRHLVMDAGAGYDIRTAKLTATLTIVLSTALTTATWAYILLG